MAGLVAKVEAGFEPIAGYVLRELLGSGGFGEVWMADAPGGLKKAIKFVFGSVEDERAAGELKSLQRIRQVNHPFLLSLERIEIVQGQLMIVTELAECSLADKFQSYRDKGLAGIPRDHLLDYMRDAADALDFLCKNHDLQHLDVKPANMLLVADRVKVADFGLIKDVESQSMSMIGGLTLNYAAPEMFDGRPGRFSDQYSLAIVYQELLTGTLPFRGRTAAQLASEHLHKAPNLESLPPNDRAVINKALSKKVGRRFASCKEFVDHLIAAGRTNEPLSLIDHSAAVVARPNTPWRDSRQQNANAFPSSPIQRETSVTLSTVTPLTQQFEEREAKTLAASTLEAVPQSPAVFIGLGGTGADVLRTVRSQLEKFDIDLEEHPEWAWLAVDSDSKSIGNLIEVTTEGRLTGACTLLTPLHSSQYYRQQEGPTFSPLSRRWLYNVPRSRTTEGVRPLGMLAFLNSAARCKEVVDNYVEHFSRYASSQPESPLPPVRFYLVASAHGGTGSAMLSEFAFLIRQAASRCGLPIVLQAAVVVADQEQNELGAASAISFLTELSHHQNTNGLHPGLPGVETDPTPPRPPFDYVQLAYGGESARKEEWDIAVDDLASFLLLDGCSGVGYSLDQLRQETLSAYSQQHDVDWTPWLRTVSGKAIDIKIRWTRETFSDLSIFHVIQRWAARLAVDRQFVKQFSEAQQNGTTLQRSKHHAQIDSLISDLFRQNQWTAQAWIKRCSEVFANQCNLEPAAETHEQPNPWMGSPLELPLEKFADCVQIDRINLGHSIQQLIQECLHEFTTWFGSQWIRSKSAWCYFSEMLIMVAHRFDEQGKSLCRVAAHVRDNRDQLLEQLHLAQLDEETHRAELENVSALEIQYHTHELSGQILVAISKQISTISQHWKTQSDLFDHILQSWSQPIVESLGLKVNDQGKVVESPLPTPSRWQPVKDKLESMLDTTIESVLIQQVCKACDWSLPDSISTIQFEQDSIHTLRTHALETAQSVAESLEIEIPTAQGDQDIESHSIDGAALNSLSEMPMFHPSLLKSGGAKRAMLILPTEMTTEDAKNWQEQLGLPLSVGFSSVVKTPVAFCEGEQFSLQDTILRMWMPCKAKWELADRLHTRIDIDWLPPESQHG